MRADELADRTYRTDVDDGLIAVGFAHIKYLNHFAALVDEPRAWTWEVQHCQFLGFNCVSSKIKYAS